MFLQISIIVHEYLNSMVSTIIIVLELVTRNILVTCMIVDYMVGIVGRMCKVVIDDVLVEWQYLVVAKCFYPAHRQLYDQCDQDFYFLTRKQILESTFHHNVH